VNIHLTQTGLYAGRRLCPTSRADGEPNAHAIYAPLNSADYRAGVCPECLKTWAYEAYEAGDDMPEWIKALRADIDNIGGFLRFNDQGA